ncbi:BglG family transcription antiterminator [Clostridioides difficile]
MNSKENNKKQILLMLLNSDKPITISKISSQLNVSSKTVRNYLDEIQLTLNNSDIKIIKKPNVGIYLNIDKEKKSLLKDKLNILIDDIYSSKYRKRYILKTLFKNRYTYTIQLFADDLYCSKNTILSDLVYVEKWLKNHNLHLVRKQNQGLWIEGNENVFRDAMMSFFCEISYENTSTDSLKSTELDYRLDNENYNKIKRFFPKLDFLMIQEIIQKAEEKLGYYFTDQAFVNLIVHIAIALERVKFEKNISMEKDNFENIKGNKEYSIAKWVVDQLSINLNIKIPENEIAYICLHMLGSKIQQDIFVDDYASIINSQDAIYIQVAKEIIQLVSDILRVNLYEDTILLTGLVIHLRPTIIRLKNNLELRNPLLSRIKNEYLSIFGATWSCNSIFERNFNVSINEDEVGYISLHIASAIERISNKVKAVIICSSGIGTSQLVANRLKKALSDLEITSIIPAKQLTNKLIEENDIIISTIAIRKKIDKVVCVSTFINENDISRIQLFLSKNKFKNDNLDITSNTNITPDLQNKNDIISSEYCFIDEGNNSYIDTLKKYSSILEKNSIVKPGFFNNILKREQMNSTIIGNGITIPHSQEEFVIQPKICIVKLNNPIIWQDQKVDLILILALKFKDISTTKLFFKNFYSILDNKDIIEKIKHSNSVEEITSIFLN